MRRRVQNSDAGVRADYCSSTFVQAAKSSVKEIISAHTSDFKKEKIEVSSKQVPGALHTPIMIVRPDFNGLCNEKPEADLREISSAKMSQALNSRLKNKLSSVINRFRRRLRNRNSFPDITMSSLVLLYLSKIQPNWF
jgi:hypothetical protein